MTSRPRVRAPELTGRAWLNTGDQHLHLADLRGRIVLLDFWTFCCVNCLHVIDELREVEADYADVLVVVGVHSPKFAHEADPEALLAAVERYEVRHPVLDDPELGTWRQYGVRAWPTLVVIDPEGYVVATMSGEGHGQGLRTLLDELVAEATEKGTLRRGDSPYVAPPPLPGPLRFPGKVVATDQGLLVSDTGNHSLVLLDATDGRTVLRRYGSGRRGRVDGPADDAEFNEPQGLCLLPAEVASDLGYDVVVADTVNHVLRGLSLQTGEIRTVAGTGEQMRTPARGGAAREQDLSSPWDVVWWPPLNAVVVAMAGVHQLWVVDLGAGTARPLAGTRGEGLRDGAADEALLAQPSGLAAAADRLWFVDAETSALRWLELTADGAAVRTAVGAGLFDFGHVDGPADAALFQHPLGLCLLPDGSIAVFDTYNDAVRRYDPVNREVSTLATGVREPSGGVLADGALWVVESAAHQLVQPVTPGVVSHIARGAQQTARPETDLAPGPLALEVIYEAPAGQHLDERYGPSTRLVVTASPPELLVDGGGAGTDLSRKLQLAAAVPAGVLHVTASAASCDDEGEFPACHVTTQDWGIPVRVRPGAADRLGLVLRGIDAG